NAGRSGEWNDLQALRFGNPVGTKVESGNCAGSFELADLTDATGMTILLGPLGGQESFNNLKCFSRLMLTSAHGHNLGVIMFASKLSRGNIPGQGRANALNFIGSHLLPIARTAEHNTQGILASRAFCGDRFGSINAK